MKRKTLKLATAVIGLFSLENAKSVTATLQCPVLNKEEFKKTNKVGAPNSYYAWGTQLSYNVKYKSDNISWETLGETGLVAKPKNYTLEIIGEAKPSLGFANSPVCSYDFTFSGLTFLRGGNVRRFDLKPEVHGQETLHSCTLSNEIFTCVKGRYQP
jgi:hypothetical protein